MIRLKNILLYIRPLTDTDMIFGYMLPFGAFPFVQSTERLR